MVARAERATQAAPRHISNPRKSPSPPSPSPVAFTHPYSYPITNSPQAATTVPLLAPGYVVLPTMPTVANGGVLTTTAGSGWTMEFWCALLRSGVVPDGGVDPPRKKAPPAFCAECKSVRGT